MVIAAVEVREPDSAVGVCVLMREVVLQQQRAVTEQRVGCAFAHDAMRLRQLARRMTRTRGLAVSATG